MADIAASVLTRLKNKAQASGRSYQLCLQLFCQEEFLRRLEKSKYAENFVLKGGLFIYSLTEFDSRVTVDVDFFTAAVMSFAVCHTGSRAVTKTSTVCFICTMSIISCNLNIASGTELIFIVKTFCGTTFQNCHNRSLLLI